MLVPVSVIIPVKNEELNIRACLESVKWADEIFILDSHSIDQTVDIAREYTDKIVQFDYKDGYPKKKNWALENLPFRNEWVFIIDADERVSGELQQEICEVFENGPKKDGYYVKWQFFFLGRWLRHGGWYPTWILRLFKHRMGRYERFEEAGQLLEGDVEVHEHIVLQGDAGYLQSHLIHENFKSLYDWLDKHNRYSTWAASVHRTAAPDKGRRQTRLKPRLFGTQPERRRWFRRLLGLLPGKPLLVFVYTYLLRGGFLDGKPGFIYCVLQAIQEFHISAKIFELKNSQRAIYPQHGTGAA